MPELKMADLKSDPANYESSRDMFDVLVGEDLALPLIEASSSGDTSALQSMLSQPEWIKTASEKQHAIYYVDRSPREGDVRTVSAQPYSNLERAVFKAAEHNQAAAVSTLLDFASQQAIKPSSVISRWTVERAIRSGRSAVLEALASADPTVVRRDLNHGVLSLDLAVKAYQTECVAVLLKHGADPSPNATTQRSGKCYQFSLLCLSIMADGTRMTELLLEHGVPIAGSAVLHYAAEFGHLDSMDILIQHGADVNEQLTPQMLPVYLRTKHAGKTPLHMAALKGKVDAMKLLESHGARSDVKDMHGMTPAEALEE